ncbi:hypothetical protein CA54_40660 [Symmachiella macrocystis]|uniref:Uncharacterized protein n=1 Tax=Symmachiella macrocystis TaxID=2527985 RepID=A0A5C6BC18_9PLAN|nr:hypothetical protein CA54_40660 [Symmachiella macrocystis]
MHLHLKRWSGGSLGQIHELVDWPLEWKMTSQRIVTHHHLICFVNLKDDSFVARSWLNSELQPIVNLRIAPASDSSLSR